MSLVICSVPLWYLSWSILVLIYSEFVNKSLLYGSPRIFRTGLICDRMLHPKGTADFSNPSVSSSDVSSMPQTQQFQDGGSHSGEEVASGIPSVISRTYDTSSLLFDPSSISRPFASSSYVSSMRWTRQNQEAALITVVASPTSQIHHSTNPP